MKWTAEPMVVEPSAFEAEVCVEKFISYESPSAN
jgi:hypothetical protein